MKSYTFHFEVEDILQQFAAALNDIIVKRYNKEREPQDQIHVNFVYAPKTRTLAELTNKAQHFKLPCISISLGGIRRNNNRVFNKLDGSWWTDTMSRSPSGAKWINLLQPVPIDLTVNVSIISRFQTDIDQILTNFIPYTDPYFVISWKWPEIIEIADFEIRSICKWNENVSVSYPIDINKGSPYWVTADTSFNIESWMFKNMQPDGKPIYVIDVSFSSVSAIDDFDIMKSFENVYNTDTFTISARPQSMSVEPFITYIGNPWHNPNKEFTITGKMMSYVQSVYLSSADWSMFNYSNTGDFVSSGPGTVSAFSLSSFSASAAYPDFTGIELLSSNWWTDNNHVKFSFTPLQSGIFDVVLLNQAGYGIMTQDCIRPTTNPYKEGTDEYNGYTEFQYPYVSGIEVKCV
ncbi:MAG: tail sheath stabilizer and completion protein [Patescibacteria group bacterium]|jgi:hypothetical protein